MHGAFWRLVKKSAKYQMLFKYLSLSYVILYILTSTISVERSPRKICYHLA